MIYWGGGVGYLYHVVGIKKINLGYLTDFVISKLILYRPSFNYMFLHLWFFFFHVKSLSLKFIALIAWGKYLLLRIMYQICFILVRISFFPCKQNYTVILSAAETLGRKSLLWIPRKFPLITFCLYCRLQDSDTIWNQAIQNQCLPPKITVG